MNIEKLKNLVYDYYEQKAEQVDNPNVPDRVAIPALTKLEKQQMEDEKNYSTF